MKNTPIALDMMVINKKVNNSSKKHEVYSLIDKIVLEGSNLPAATEEGSEEPWIGETNKDDEFVYGPTLNFDFVSYTPTL
jgi:spermidine/putrescine transport system substrate-binding protein